MGAPSIGDSRVVFGQFEADLISGELYRSGRRVSLQEKPFRILARLLEHPGEIITREELRHQLWPQGTFVDFDEGLDTAVKKLRYALGDSAQNPIFIETIPRRGYRFIAPVTNAAAAATPPIIPSPAPVTSPGAPAVKSQKGKYFVGVAAIALVLVAAWGIHRRSTHAREFRLRHLQMTRLTDGARVSHAAISPDGRYVVYARREGSFWGNESLWLRDTGTGGDVQLLPSGPVFRGLTFSPAGSSIYFVRADEKDPFFRYLYAVPTLGGPARKLITDVDSPITFSPDGRRFIYEHCIPPRNDIELKIANTDGTEDRLLATIHDGSNAVLQPGPSWSPDGRTIAVPIRIAGQHQRWLLEMVSFADGSVNESYSSSQAIGRPVWMPGGGALIFPHTSEVTHHSQLWTVSFPEGKARQVTNDPFDYGDDLDLTRDGSTLVAVSNTLISNVWIAPAADPSAARQITSEPSETDIVTEASDGDLLTTGVDGILWKMHTDGSQRARFTEVRDVLWPASCGRFVIFTATEADAVALIRVNRDGTHPVTLAQGNLWSPACSADGDFVFYLTVDQPEKIWKVPVAGGSPQYVSDVLGDQHASNFAIYRDGRLLAYPYTQFGRVPSEGWKMAILSVDGGPPVKQFSIPGGIGLIGWSPDGKGLQYVLSQNGADNIWEQPLTGGTAKQVTRFSTGEISYFDWSFDKTRLLLARGNRNSEVVLLKNGQRDAQDARDKE